MGLPQGSDHCLPDISISRIYVTFKNAKVAFSSASSETAGRRLPHAAPQVKVLGLFTPPRSTVLGTLCFLFY